MDVVLGCYYVMGNDALVCARNKLPIDNYDCYVVDILFWRGRGSLAAGPTITTPADLRPATLGDFDNFKVSAKGRVV